MGLRDGGVARRLPRRDVNAALYLHALRAARGRQLRARCLEPLNRRRFPASAAPRDASPIPAAEPLWRSTAFEETTKPDASTRLGRFELQYGHDVLAAARAGDAAAARTLVDRWIALHPPRNDDAWHPYPLSTRAGNWIAALTLVPELGSAALSQSLWRQLLRLDRNVEDGVLGNHVIRNARALVLGGAAFGEHRLTRRGIDLLRRELAEQILADGGHYERSPFYHLVVLRDLLEVQAVSPQSWLADAINRMRRFASALQRPDGKPALFNDGTTAAPVLDLPPTADGLAVFEQSGFVVARDGQLWLAFRCGPAAPDFLPPHAHADALSLQVWWRGSPVVVDAGTSTYEPGEVRAWERGTAAHSTVVVDGRDQFTTWGAFRSGPLPRVKLLDARHGSVEAYVDLAGGIRHVRRVEWDAPAGEITVHDTLVGSGRHRIDSRVVWAPSLPPPTLEWSGLADVRTEAAWTAERMGERVPTTATCASATTTLPATSGFRLRLLE